MCVGSSIANDHGQRKEQLHRQRQKHEALGALHALLDIGNSTSRPPPCTDTINERQFCRLRHRPSMSDLDPAAAPVLVKHLDAQLKLDYLPSSRTLDVAVPGQFRNPKPEIYGGLTSQVEMQSATVTRCPKAYTDQGRLIE